MLSKAMVRRLSDADPNVRFCAAMQGWTAEARLHDRTLSVLRTIYDCGIRNAMIRGALVRAGALRRRRSAQFPGPRKALRP